MWLVAPKSKWFTWLNHAPFRDGLPSMDSFYVVRVKTGKQIVASYKTNAFFCTINDVDGHRCWLPVFTAGLCCKKNSAKYHRGADDKIAVQCEWWVLWSRWTQQFLRFILELIQLVVIIRDCLHQPSNTSWNIKQVVQLSHLHHSKQQNFKTVTWP